MTCPRWRIARSVATELGTLQGDHDLHLATICTECASVAREAVESEQEGGWDRDLWADVTRIAVEEEGGGGNLEWWKWLSWNYEVRSPASLADSNVCERVVRTRKNEEGRIIDFEIRLGSIVRQIEVSNCQYLSYRSASDAVTYWKTSMDTGICILILFMETRTLCMCISTVRDVSTGTFRGCPTLNSEVSRNKQNRCWKILMYCIGKSQLWLTYKRSQLRVPND